MRPTELGILTVRRCGFCFQHSKQVRLAKLTESFLKQRCITMALKCFPLQSFSCQPSNLTKLSSTLCNRKMSICQKINKARDATVTVIHRPTVHRSTVTVASLNKAMRRAISLTCASVFSEFSDFSFVDYSCSSLLLDA
jgi:hypothetical protein